MESDWLAVSRWTVAATATLTLIGGTLPGGSLARGGAAREQAGSRELAGSMNASRVAQSPPRPAAPSAHSSREVSVNDSGRLHLLKAFGAVLLEEGPAGGTLPGQARVRMTVGPTVHASFTIRARGWSISGHGGAVLHSSGRYASFGGWLSVSGGTGRFAHAHGSGRLYGVIDRRTDALTVQTIGRLDY